MKKFWAKKALKGGLIGFGGGVVFFVFAIIVLGICEQTAIQSIVENGFIMLTYIPLKVFSFCVDKGSINKHDAVAAAAFIGIWFCTIASIIGFSSALLFCLEKDKGDLD
jgi:hypothetical protein